jgi:hypothetical protein
MTLVLDALTDDLAAGRVCDVCGERRAAVQVEVLAVDGTPALDAAMCSDDVAAALAIRFGSAHVRAGGDLGDLRQ